MSNNPSFHSATSDASASETLSTDRRKRRTPTAPRRSHLKSRTGCRTCKARKIKVSSGRQSICKCVSRRRTWQNTSLCTSLSSHSPRLTRLEQCDEQRPSCRNCLKRRADCEFLSESSVYPNFGTKDEAALTLNMLDLQLMHHFTTSTYATLFCYPPVRHFWRGEAVQMGFRCDYVMRAILAVSALHLAYHSPERREMYTSTALTYHRIASRQAMGLMSDLKEENASNLFIFSILTMFFGLCPSTRHPINNFGSHH